MRQGRGRAAGEERIGREGRAMGKGTYGRRGEDRWREREEMGEEEEC